MAGEGRGMGVWERRNSLEILEDEGRDREEKKRRGTEKHK